MKRSKTIQPKMFFKNWRQFIKMLHNFGGHHIIMVVFFSFLNLVVIFLILSVSFVYKLLISFKRSSKIGCCRAHKTWNCFYILDSYLTFSTPQANCMSFLIYV